ncbi:MAG: hypothetical protein FWD69_10805, partial [Polyangiaceae bacterium]|nr:hypothetical protein [Polyangiaceae bacterium]
VAPAAPGCVQHGDSLPGPATARPDRCLVVRSADRESLIVNQLRLTTGREVRVLRGASKRAVDEVEAKRDSNKLISDIPGAFIPLRPPLPKRTPDRLDAALVAIHGCKISPHADQVEMEPVQE